MSSGKIVRLAHGSELSVAYLEKCGFERPILVERADGLSLCVPSKDALDLTRIETIVGGDVRVDVIDSERQETVPMTIGELNGYFRCERRPRDKTYNLISFEISRTKLNEAVRVPAIVSQISWMSNGVWPTTQETTEQSDQVRPRSLNSNTHSFESKFHIFQFLIQIINRIFSFQIQFSQIFLMKVKCFVKKFKFFLSILVLAVE